MLIKKMLRDIRKNKVQFLAVFLMMFTGCFIYSGITGEWSGLEQNFDTYIKEQKLADAWVYREAFSEEDLEKINGDDRVEKAEGRMTVTAALDGKEERSLDCYIASENTVSALYVLEGQAFDGKIKGLWVDAMFAEENGYHTGDTMTLNVQGVPVKGTIKGLVYSPEYIYGATQDEMTPNHKKNGFVWVSKTLWAETMPFICTQAAVTLEDGYKGSILKEILDDDNLKLIEAGDHPSVSMVRDEISQHQSIGDAFAIAFLLIALMITVTTMHRMLKNQRTQIGILKALGFTDGKLLVHYLSHSGFVCALGALLGSILGYQVLPGLIYRFMRTMYVLPVWKGQFPLQAALLPALCTVASVAISLCICRGYLRGTAAENISGDKEAGITVGTLSAFARSTEAFSFGSRWNLRDIARNRLRSFMTLCGVLGCTALLFCAFVLFDTFDNLSRWTFTSQQDYACKITGLPGEEAAEEIRRLTGGELLMETTALVKGKKEEEVNLTVPESTDYWKLAENLHTFTDIGDGIALSKKTAEKLKVKEGDWITWRKTGEKEWQKSQIEAVVRTPLSQGIVMKKQAYTNTGQKYAATAVIGNEPEDGFGKYEKLCTISKQKDLEKSIDSVMEGMIMMISILVTGAVLLGSIMLYNLGVLSYLERYREFATMKVLGFADGRIRRIMVQQNVWLSGIGIVLGIPAGYGLLYYMLSTIPDSMDVPVYVRPISWGIGVGGTLLLSWAVSRIVSGKIPGIDMVEALKGRE